MGSSTLLIYGFLNPVKLWVLQTALRRSDSKNWKLKKWSKFWLTGWSDLFEIRRRCYCCHWNWPNCQTPALHCTPGQSNTDPLASGTNRPTWPQDPTAIRLRSEQIFSDVAILLNKVSPETSWSYKIRHNMIKA